MVKPVVLLLLVFSGFCSGEVEKAQPKEPKVLTIAFGNKLAPWVFPESDRGIIVDIVSEALTPLGYIIQKEYVPYARRINAFRKGTVDVSSDMNVNTITNESLQGYFSDTAYTYQNYAFALAKHNYSFTHLKELSQYSLLSWQGATVHLGQEYRKMASSSSLYSETYDQQSQVRMLFLERVDVIQMDRQIFNYYRVMVSKNSDINVSAPIAVFPLFGSSPNGFLFKSKKVRNEFNERLKEMKEQGHYQAIFERYSAKSFGHESKHSSR